MAKFVFKPKGAERHGNIRHGRLPWTDELVLYR